MVQVKLSLRSEDNSVKVLMISAPSEDSLRIYFCNYPRGYTGEKFMRRSESLRSSTSLAPHGFQKFRLWMLKVLLLWNWKSAVLSVALRVPIFAVATIRRGPEVVVGAILTEAMVCAFNAGCYAAVVQVLRNRKPVWLVATTVSILLPVIGQVIEYEVHAWHGTPHRIIAVIVSSVLSVISSLFNWYAMKQGTLLVGDERSSFSGDLRRLPGLIGRFLLLAPRWLGRRMGWMALPSN
jgi:hypothetical protein